MSKWVPDVSRGTSGTHFIRFSDRNVQILKTEYVYFKGTVGVEN